MILGRDLEKAHLAGMLDAVVQGRGAALVVRGEAGIGKSALLTHMAELAADVACQLRVTATEAETDLPFAGLHALLHPVRERVDSLPEPQADALHAAFGLRAAAEGRDRFLVGLAVLTLLAEVAEERPVVCLVDDAQWLDQSSADALLFAARRLQAERVMVLFGMRDGDRPFPTAGIAELPLHALDETQSAALLAEHCGELAPAVRDRVVAESGGNPLTLIELSRMLGPDQRAGKLPPLGLYTEASSPLGRLESAFQKRIGVLPKRSRTLLTVAAAEGTGDLGLIMSAATALGVGVTDLEPVEHAGLVRIDGGLLVFRHPLVKAAAYRGATLSWRQDAHRVLADVLASSGDEDGEDRRTQHLAAATTGIDENLGRLLERAADRATRRGALAVAATGYERAAQLTGNRELRARRLALAAEKAAEGGQLSRAGGLAERGERLTTAPEAKAELVSVRAAREFELGDAESAGRIMVEAAAAIVTVAPAKAREMLGVATTRSYLAGDLETVRRAARVMTATTAPGPEAIGYLPGWVRGCALLLSGDHLGGLRMMRSAMRTGGKPVGATISYALFNAILLGDDREAEVLADEYVRQCRDTGQISELTHALQIRTQIRILTGRHAEAKADGAELLHLSEATGHTRRAGHLRGILALLSAIEGKDAECESLARHASAGAAGASWGGYALGLLALGRGDHRSTVRHLNDLLSGRGGHTVVAKYAIPSLVEALVRLGRPDPAAGHFARFRDWAEASDQPWALGLVHRCIAMLSPAAKAEPHYLTALEHHDRGTRPFDQAHTLLLCGEWLRRARRRSEAAKRLRAAADIFHRLGASPWLKRANHELAAIGARPRSTTQKAGALDLLTAQESQVVRLAATGASNREIAAQLFLSPRTVGYHLYNAFRKLGVGSRTELARYGSPDS
ncbi:LuxR C-terminal-related transcriptional regulator [Amycolatopsis cynarae]|uniref:LuxR C-terminal-related transcriptional regulator n=1 Tax=Amycolatopsis cynarae TaxID=2995223 RepID=A0ABY7B645_9PSEU|nr:LuxR family transcriptional regulator [Amycolatopsis sp. HUAS 11-8]WAL67811.1 LuxR C-terminal-related transcriptional regulator [Amycolatopsis sp. HUAS 11-8]